jgi:hypothetical protein
MFHDVSLDERKAGAWVVVEDVHRHVKLRPVRQQDLKLGVLVTQIWLTGELTLAPDDRFGSGRPVKRDEPFEK